MQSAVEEMYDRDPNHEWHRLERHTMEYQTTMMALEAFLKPSSRILDVGGGPGRYSISLAQAGHAVTLLDLSQANVDFAKRKAEEMGVLVEEFVKGDATDLSHFDEGGFDAVLLMGPLYHLLTDELRRKAVSEAFRVLAPGGAVFASFITRYAFLIDRLAKAPEDAPDLRADDSYRLLLETGLHRSSEHEGFTDAYFMHPFDIKPFMESCGLETLRLAAAEGILGASESQLTNVTPEAFDRWASICYQLGTDPCVWGTACHMLYVGVKR